MKALKRRGRFLPVLACVLLVVLFAGGLYALHKTRTAPLVCAPTAKNNYFNNAAANLSPQQRAKLQPIVASIQNTKGYQKDVNCLYIVSYYQVELGNAVDGRKNFDQMTTLSKTQKVNPNLVQKGWDMAEFKKRLEILEAQAKEFRKNFVGIN